MTDFTLNTWLEGSPENRRLFAQEGLILEATEAIWEALETRNWKKQDLAHALGCSKAHVTQLLNGGRNMTLRTLADIAEALDHEVRVDFVPKEQAIDWRVIEGVIVKPQRYRSAAAVIDAPANEHWIDLELTAA